MSSVAQVNPDTAVSRRCPVTFEDLEARLTPSWAWIAQRAGMFLCWVAVLGAVGTAIAGPFAGIAGFVLGLVVGAWSIRGSAFFLGAVYRIYVDEDGSANIVGPVYYQEPIMKTPLVLEITVPGVFARGMIVSIEPFRPGNSQVWRWIDVYDGRYVATGHDFRKVAVATSLKDLVDVMMAHKVNR